MRKETVARLEREKTHSKGRMRKPEDLLNRRVSAADFMDAALIGGIELKDVIAGHIAETQIPPEVIKAFHEQYPKIHASFVDEVHRLSSNPDALMGFVNGVKGKLFEVQYAAWLNDGHLPAGYHAALAHAANNPAWDISIRGVAGHVRDELQLKATNDIAYVHHAVVTHPNIDVIVPGDVYRHFTQHADLVGHVFGAPETLHGLGGEVGSAIGDAHAALAFHFPALAVVFAGWHSFTAYRTGKLALAEAVRSFAQRSALTAAAGWVGWKVALLLGHPLLAIPFAILSRIFGATVLAANELAQRIETSVARTAEAIRALRENVARRPLALPA